MKNPVVVVGIGEMGSVFARGFLRLGHPAYPVTRVMKMLEPGIAITTSQLYDYSKVLPYLTFTQRVSRYTVYAAPQAPWRRCNFCQGLRPLAASRALP